MTNQQSKYVFFIVIKMFFDIKKNYSNNPSYNNPFFYKKKLYFTIFTTAMTANTIKQNSNKMNIWTLRLN